MHQIRRIITVAQLHVFRRVLLHVRGILRVFEVFVQLLGLKLALYEGHSESNRTGLARK